MVPDTQPNEADCGGADRVHRTLTLSLMPLSHYLRCPRASLVSKTSSPGKSLTKMENLFNDFDDF